METRHTPDTSAAKDAQIVLKRDIFGTIRHDIARNCIIRETADAPAWLRGPARWLARREAQTLRQLAGRCNCPQFAGDADGRFVRSFLPGQPLYAVRFDPQPYFRDALRQMRRMHACKVAHNDLAKEANWICMPGNAAGIVDFQIALRFARRGRLFRTLAHEDLRHLLKHKQHYASEQLTSRQRAILAHPLWTARVWRTCFKPVYRFITRRLLGWPERNSAIERSI